MIKLEEYSALIDELEDQHKVMLDISQKPGVRPATIVAFENSRRSHEAGSDTEEPPPSEEVPPQVEAQPSTQAAPPPPQANPNPPARGGRGPR